MGAPGWPFVGRDVELGAARAVVRGRGALVVAGEAGVGKSRFARELAAQEGREPIVVVASASSREIPLGAFASVLGVSATDAGGLSDLERALDALRARRTVLVIDDAHQLDEVSATVVAQLVAEGAPPVLLVVRSGEPAPEAVTAVWKDGHADRMNLAPLGEPSSVRLLRAALGGKVDHVSGQRLVTAARGNVLWLRHLVEGEQEAGRLAVVDGAWRWAGLDGLPAALRDLVAARIGRLTDEQRRVLELLALSEPLGLDLLADLSGEQSVEEVSQRGLITLTPDGARQEVRLGHPLYGEAVRVEVGPVRERRLRGELSAALGRAGGRRADDGLRRAVLDLGSDRRPDPELLHGAAVQASALGDFSLAERLWRAARDDGGGFDVRIGLAQLMIHLARIHDAVPELEAAGEAAQTPVERLRAATLRAHFEYFLLASTEDAVATLDRVGAAIGPSAAPTLDAMRGVIALGWCEFSRGTDLVDRALADPDLPDLGVTLATWAGAHARAFTGRGAPLGEIVERGLDAAPRSHEMALMRPNIGFTEVLDADFRGELDAAAHRLAWVRTLTGIGAVVFGAIYDGRAALSRGELRRALVLTEIALPYLPGHGGGWAVFLHSAVARCHALLGEGPAARVALATAEESRHPAVRILEWELALARGWTAAAEGDGRDAIRHVLRGADRAREDGMAPIEVLLRQAAVRFGDRGQGRRLDQLAAELDSVRARLAAAHARALARSDVARLLTVSADLEAAGMVLEAADAAAQASTLARTQGSLATSSDAEARVRSLAARCDDAVTPAIREATVPLPLTDREREIALLAAEGLTNKDIAGRLQVSIRTVESHVYRAYTRLGLPDRAALVAVVRPSSARAAPEVP